MSDLLNELRQAASPPAPRDFRPGVVYSGRMPSEITTDALPVMDTEDEWEEAVRAMGIRLPKGFGLVLVEAVLAGSYNEASWHRDPEDRREKDTAYTAPNTTQRWRYRFKVVLKDPRADEDIAVLMAEAKKAKRGKPLTTKKGGTLVVTLADFQVGKTDVLGGTPELLERSEKALADTIARVRHLRPTQILLADGGDSTEGYESSPNADRTNDLQQTEQIRVWRRIFWRWISALAPLTEDLIVAGVPSNHCRVRRGKQYLGDALDDWGIEVIAQVSDIADANPEAYGHVKFVVPDEHQEHVLLELAGGKLLGLVHGHQVNRPDQLPEFIKRNSRSGIGQADIVICGHFHHLRAGQAFGDDQYLFIAPTMDNGSSWFAASGERSRPGLLTFVVDADGWRDMNVCWT